MLLFVTSIINRFIQPMYVEGSWLKRERGGCSAMMTQDILCSIKDFMVRWRLLTRAIHWCSANIESPLTANFGASERARAALWDSSNAARWLAERQRALRRAIVPCCQGQPSCPIERVSSPQSPQLAPVMRRSILVAPYHPGQFFQKLSLSKKWNLYF